MKLLLDTHLLLWAAADPARLSSKTQKLLRDESNELIFSAASMWEVTIKNSLARDDFRVEPRVLRRSLLDNGYVELPITSEHAVGVEILPSLHKDHFDRMLLAQAIAEGITLLTGDVKLARYGAPVRKV